MRQSGAMTTCVPVRFDGGPWETAVFFEIGGKECRKDRRVLRRTLSAVPIVAEMDMIEHSSAAVVMLRFEVLTDEHSPLVGEVLLTPGLGDVQFDTLRHLGRQPQIRWYFADASYQVIHAQQSSLHDSERAGYYSLLQRAVKHDALIRIKGRYDAQTAIREVLSHYQAKNMQGQ